MTHQESLTKVIEEIREEYPGMLILENEPFSKHGSMRVGGPIRAIASPGDVFSLSKVCSFLKRNAIAPFILGNGTNVVIPDEGLDLFMIKTEKLTKMWMQSDGSLYAEAGNSLARVSQFAQSNGRAGLEFASGIPGTLGGGILMNAGAYGGEMKDYIRTVIAIKLEDQSMYEIEAKDCDFGYRHSLFEDGGYVILASVFDLPEGDKDAIAEQMRTLNEKRRNSQPLDLPSCGSAFKRPVGGYAAALIEEAGLKGYSVGGAQVSEKHSGFVVNKGGATYDDIVALMDHIRKEVKKNSGITLEPEMKIYPKKMILVDQTPVEIPEELKEEFEKFKQERAKQKKDEEN